MPNKPKAPPKGWLWTEGAADYLGVHYTTLYRWRRDAVGPKCTRHGLRAYKYKIADLDAWMNSDHADEQARVAA